VVFLPRVRLSPLGWIALVAMLIGVFVALAVVGGPRPRPILGVVPTPEGTVSPTGIPAASIEPAPAPTDEIAATCSRSESDSVHASSTGGSLSAAAPKPGRAPSNGVIAYATRSAILTYDPASGTTTNVATLSQTPSDLVVGELTWSPDGQRLAFALGRGRATSGVSVDVLWCELMVMNADGSGLTALAPLLVDSRDSVENILWSPDGRSIAYNTGGSDFLAVLAFDGSPRELPGTVECWGAAWSPDGTRIACIGGGSIVTVATGNFVTLDLNANGDPGSPVWAADSQSITALGQPAQESFSAYRIGTDGTVLSSVELPGSSAWTPGLQLSPDGSRVLARVCRTPCVDEVEYQIVPVDGSPAISLGRGYGAVWSDHGSMVALTTAGGIVVADASDGTKRLAAQVTSASGVRWSPDQRSVLYTLENGQPWIVPAAGGDPTRVDEGSLSTSSGVAWQPTWP